ncbi:MAG: type II toxin-antitoxin system prevent-host-death family antitoxin [Gammaproteobacteria bacterium]
MIVNISEAKTQLSKLVDMVFHGEKVVIAKNNLPLVDLVPHQPEGKRKLGLLGDQVEIPDDFLDEIEDINEMFYGKVR